ncbi:MAG TPA: hypothetical protein VHC22_15775 [Pirellulales bacterium]|nr:hypothetical protein [Pirellulales bacterium]
MATSVFDAINLGVWDFEPDDSSTNHFHPTEALPGSREKLDVLAERLRLGQPLWHNADRLDCENLPSDRLPRA